MNVSNAYSQQNILGVQETQRAQSNTGQSQKASTSGRDTVSISPEAQALAKAAQEQEQAASNEELYCQIDMSSQTTQIIAKLIPQEFAFDAAKNERHRTFLRRVMDSYERGEMTADELGNVMKQYALTGEGDGFKQIRGEKKDEYGEYLVALLTTYASVIHDMGLSVSAGEKQREVSPEEARAVEEEVILRLKSDERTNYLMQLLDVHA
jgi:hypothetical protein